MKQDTKKVFIKNFGCQMNVRDSEALTGILLKKGYTLTDDPDRADVVIINSCAVRDHAQNRAVWFAASLARLKTKGRRGVRFDRTSASIGRGTIIAFIGCVAQREGQALFKKYKHIDLILGSASLDKTLEYIAKIRKTGKRFIDIEDRPRTEHFYHAEYRDEKDHAQVVISTGCSNYCAYCVVPSARGSLRLRSPKDILAEVRRNVKLGKTKITLLGQNVNDYNYTSHVRASATSGRPSSHVTFIDLLKMVEQVPDVEKIDFVTSHPKNTSVELFRVMASSPKFKKNLHLPFQAGSNKILTAMNRGYTREFFARLITDYKRIVGGTLGTDIIVGFPGETEEDFLKTREMVEQGQFEYAYIYKYSPRPNTPAVQLKDDVPEKEKSRRHKIVLDLLRKMALNRHR